MEILNMHIQEEQFSSVTLFKLENNNGVTVKITNWGACITSIVVPDRKGNFDDVVLGYNSLKEYVNAVDKPYFGATVGRYGNRIADARFTLDGQEYELLANDGPNHLHGGGVGFDKVVWDAEQFSDLQGVGVTMSYLAKDGEENYPGNLKITVTFTLTDKNEILIDYNAVTDAATPLNPTNHSYFNLKGEGCGDVLGHEVQLMADSYTPVSKSLIPTGEIRPVKGTPFDFRQSKTIRQDISADDQQLLYGQGYDHNFVLNKENEGEVEHAATVYDPDSGRKMEVHTDQPGVQFYTGNNLDGRLVGKSGLPYNCRGGMCLETQHFPDSPNQPDFPSTILRPGEKFSYRTVYRFNRDIE